MKKFLNENSINEQMALVPFYSFFLFLTYISSDHIFFWDTIQLGSMHAHFYFENNFSKLLLPDNMDSGHIPVFGMYLAFCWKIFGKTLVVSHFAMLPFLWGIVRQTFRFLKFYFDKSFIYYAMILVLADATFLSQASLVSPDIPLIFFFLLSLNSIKCNDRVFLIFGILGLFLTSMRGMMVAFSILLIDIYQNRKEIFQMSYLKVLAKMSLAYWPAAIISALFFLYHYYEKGWIAYHENSPWAESFQKVGLTGMIYNTGILGWRLLDFGRVFLWIVSLIIVVREFKKIKGDYKGLELGIYFIVVLACLSLSFLSYQYLQGHRYIMPLYFLLGIFTSYLIYSQLNSVRLKRTVFYILILGSLSGNFWIYPDKTAQGWDASLAHWPYYELRDKMNVYLEDSGIEIEKVACTFPNVSQLKYLNLGSSLERHEYLNLDINEYVIYSNIFNNFSDSEIDRLKTDFTEELRLEKRGVFMSLYKKEN